MTFIKADPILPRLEYNRPTLGYNHCAPPSSPDKTSSPRKTRAIPRRTRHQRHLSVSAVLPVETWQ